MDKIYLKNKDSIEYSYCIFRWMDREFVVHIYNGKCVCVLIAQLCPTLCNSMDSSLLGSYVYGIFKARIL